MRFHAVCILLAAATFSLACGDKDDDDKKEEAATAGSCLLKVKATDTNSSCSDYAAADAAAGKAICDAISAQIAELTATWSNAACATANVLGRCAVPAKDGAPASTELYYSPAFAGDNGEGACKGDGGTFTKA